jgi:hypothetical protein
LPLIGAFEGQAVGDDGGTPPLADEAEEEAEAEEAVEFAEAVVPAKRAYSPWVSSCFHLLFSKTNRVVRSELEPSSEITVK